jgi:hypothetical protein
VTLEHLSIAPETDRLSLSDGRPAGRQGCLRSLVAFLDSLGDAVADRSRLNAELPQGTVFGTAEGHVGRRIGGDGPLDHRSSDIA